jgi:hypothetical protein
MNLLFLPNEPTEGYQIGSRNALEKLVKEKYIDKLSIFSYQAINNQYQSWSGTCDKLLRVIEQTQPTSILIQHVGHHKFSPSYFKKIKNLYPKIPPVIAYDERDVFGYYKKPMPKAVKTLAKSCDVIFLVASGSFAKRFRKFGCKNVCYLPNASFFSPQEKPWTPTLQRDYKISMFANNTQSRLPFRSMPGALDRERLASMLVREFGQKMALYGLRWPESESNKGFLHKFKSIDRMRNCWIHVGLDHFYQYEGYFSDRLPNTLSSGTAYVCRYAPGLENFLIDGYHCRIYHHVNQAVDICKDLLRGPKEDIIKMGQRGAELAQSLLVEDVRMKNIIHKLQAFETVKRERYHLC